MTKLRITILELFIKRGPMTNSQVFMRYRGPEAWETVENELRCMIADELLTASNRRFFLRRKDRALHVINEYWLEQHRTA